MRARQARGFTLIELMVALFIAAVMFAIGYRALNQALNSRREIDQQQGRLDNLQRAMRIMEQDFELLQPRPVRNLLGDGYLPALISANSSATAGGNTLLGTSSSLDGGALPIVTFTRGGWTNPAGLQRSELQRVSYAVSNGTLQREYTPVLDATATVALAKQPLLDHVKSFTLRFMDAGHQWQTAWPASQLNLSTAAAYRTRPVAVEITIELTDWGVLRRVIEVAG